MNITAHISQELSVKESQVEAAVKLLDEGATVPFIARYRKEVTNGLDDTQLRLLEQRLVYLRELDDRRGVIIKSIEEQGKLTKDLKKSIFDAVDKARLEDLYLPYKPKRRTKAMIAKEAGLEPLAMSLLNDPNLDPKIEAEKYVTISSVKNIDNAKSQEGEKDTDIKDVTASLEGAKQILMEMFAENAELLGELREFYWDNAIVESKVIEPKSNKKGESVSSPMGDAKSVASSDGGKKSSDQLSQKYNIDPKSPAQKFKDYFEYQEAIKKIPSHRALALFRGRKETFLRVTLSLGDENILVAKKMIAKQFDIENQDRKADAWLQEVITWTWKIKFVTKLDIDAMMQLREAAEIDAIKVFANNLSHLLMGAPAGSKVVLGLDPGLRTGVKVVVVDETGKLLEHTTIFPHVPRRQWDDSIEVLNKLCVKHNVNLVSIGNGTGSRETDKLVADLVKRYSKLAITKIMVSEAGASVYSASELAAKEFPDLDVSFRGAVSIARRLQDPLAELVKIEPKAIGVGQYQHDVNQIKLGKSLVAVMEDCVNAVGVDINTASVPLLASVSGLNNTLAQNIVNYRDANGAFKNRESIKSVPRFGDKTFEQAAGFLRITGGDNPLDQSAVHPESYPIIEKILSKTGSKLKSLMGDKSSLRAINAADYVDSQFGLPTVTDIIGELEKPGRDPRPEFKAAEFKDGIDTIKDLKAGMMLEGVVTNVANFGAFVDIGVHQDGLVHMSALADKFVKDPHEIVKVGDIVKVKVLDVDVNRNRISLTMRLSDDARGAKSDGRRANESNNSRGAKGTFDKNNSARGSRGSSVHSTSPKNNSSHKVKSKNSSSSKPIVNNAFADAFKSLS